MKFLIYFTLGGVSGDTPHDSSLVSTDTYNFKRFFLFLLIFLFVYTLVYYKKPKDSPDDEESQKKKLMEIQAALKEIKGN